MDAASATARKIIEAIAHESEIRGQKGEVVHVRIPQIPKMLSDRHGQKYVVLEHHVVGGVIEFRLYGIESDRMLMQMRERAVCVMICRIVLRRYMDSRENVFVELQLTRTAQPTHRIIVYQRAPHFKASAATIYHYAPRMTDGVIEIRTL